MLHRQLNLRKLIKFLAGVVLFIDSGRSVDHFIEVDLETHAFGPFVHELRIDQGISFQKRLLAVVNQFVQILLQTLADIESLAELESALMQGCCSILAGRPGGRGWSGGR